MSGDRAMDWEVFYARFREPDFVPGYEIHNRLGGGAFGEVYKARKASIGKSYAIKFLKIDGDDQRDAAMRELEQVRHFAALDHPNLVSIEDMGEAAGVPYLIMGYAGEDTLARRLKQGPLDEATTLLYFVQVCRGVLALHDRRLVHFDLKPSNVFLKGDVARVGDYGLSKMMADGRTTLSFGRGTPQYMAPEMMRSRADHRADIYSLGVILYECFARKLPFESAVPGTLAIRENDEPPVFPGDFPAGLRHVVERCLRLSPDDRYADVGELLLDMGQTARPGDSVRIDAYAAARPVPARTEPKRSPSSSTRVDPARANVPESEARHAARELTRGAVEVARGVWDGIVTGSQARPNAAVPERPPSSKASNVSDADSGEVVAMHTLASAERNLMIQPAFSPAPAMTIPVPPLVQGGFKGTLFASIALALEILFATARGLLDLLVRLFLRGQAVEGAGFFARLGRTFVALFKMCVFLALLFALGAVTVLGGYFLFKGVG